MQEKNKEQSMNLRMTEQEECIRLMQNGSEFIKIRRKKQQYLRFYWLSPKNDELRWSPTSKKAQLATLRVQEIKDVREGTKTELIRINEMMRRAVDENCVFSIIMHGRDLRSLDLIARSAETAKMWVIGLAALINEARNHRDPIYFLSPPDSMSTSSDNGEPSDVSANVTHQIPSASKTATLQVPVQQDRTPRSDDPPLRSSRKSSLIRKLWCEELFPSADTSQLGMDGFGVGLGVGGAVLPFGEVQRILKGLRCIADSCSANFRTKLEEIDAMLRGDSARSTLVHGDRDSYRMASATADAFMTVIKLLFSRPDIYFLLVRYSGNAQFLTVGEFINFMEFEQSINLTTEEAVALIEKYEASQGKSNMRMTVTGLTNLLCDTNTNEIFNPKHSAVCQDMSRPLTHYFINSSYKTFLVGDQLAGASSIEGYIRALRWGARYIEVEVYDGSCPKDNPYPVVYRGNTLTSKIAFSAVLQSISEHAFGSSEFPLIISLQNHCGLKQQLKIVALLESTFGDALYFIKCSTQAEAADEIEREIEQLPSPEMLKRRIIIKMTKIQKSKINAVPRSRSHSGTGPVGNSGVGVVTTSSGSGYHADDAMKPEMVETTLKDGTVVKYGYITDECDSDAEYDFQSKRNSNGNCQQYRKERKKRQLKVLNDMAYMRTARFKGINKPLNNFLEVTGLSEATAKRLATSKAHAMINYTQRSLVCVYPHSSRVDSSNMNPQTFWNCGCQLVAMNFQTSGTLLDIYQGFFRKNGACGYVLKPPSLCDTIARFNLSVTLPEMAPQLLSIKVISAHKHLAAVSSDSCAFDAKPQKSTKSTLILCQIFGVSADQSEQCSHNIDLDMWNNASDSSSTLIYESFQFFVSAPQLATMRLVLLDANGKSATEQFIAQASVPVECIRTGYRVVELFGIDGSKLDATLFVHVTLANHYNFSEKCHRAATFSRSASVGRRNDTEVVPRIDVDASYYTHGRFRSHSQIGRRATADSPACITRGKRDDRRGSSREIVPIKPVGVKAVDELFRLAWPDIESARELRDSIAVSFTTLKQTCGIDTNANVNARQCARYLTNLLSVAFCSVAINEDVIDVTNTDLANTQDASLVLQLENVVNAFNRVLKLCKVLEYRADLIVDRLTGAYDRAVDSYASFPSLCQMANIKGKRLHSAMENFAANVRTIKCECDLLRVTKNESIDIAKQVRDAIENHSASVCAFVNYSANLL